MARTSSGTYQLLNGMWGFRYAFWIDGKQKDIKRTKGTRTAIHSRQRGQLSKQERRL